MRSLRSFVAFLHRFSLAQTGAAAVEFALILPIMLMLYVGANEASVLISMDRKVQYVSGAVGDLVARSEEAISASTLDDYVKVASGLVSPFTATGMEQIVTQVKVSSTGEATVDWSRGYKNQVPVSSLNRRKGSTYPLPADVTAIARDQFVIVAETKLPYTPLYGLVYKEPVTLYRENFYLPRFGGYINGP
jgi:Flp pilus assembly protein TadG